jgi:hypothetical protein
MNSLYTSEPSSQRRSSEKDRAYEKENRNRDSEEGYDLKIILSALLRGPCYPFLA